MADVPVFSEFNPRDIQWQYDLIYFMRKTYNYDVNGVLEMLMSGTVGSAKSIFAIHMAVSHCLKFSDARFGLFRKAMPDLKETMIEMLVDHMEGSEIVIDGMKDTMREGVHFTHNKQKASIDYINGAKIRSRSWADKKYKKLRSHPYSAAIWEEVTENDTEECQKVHPELFSRVGRINSINSNVKENWILYLTNPDEETHWAYNYFILDDGKFPSRKVHYSNAEDNPFLPKTYLEGLKANLSPIEAERKLRGRWVSDGTGKIYSCYKREYNYRDYSYRVNAKYPIYISWDFNIGVGKPLSLCLFQFIKGQFHFFNEIVIESMRTEESCKELLGLGFLDYDTVYKFQGDATGKARSTNSEHTNYEIIKNFFSNNKNRKNQKIMFEIDIPTANPPIKERHNRVNAYCENDEGQHRLFIYKECVNLDKGFRLCELKAGASYQEDDSKPYQHVTTAAGYGVVRCYGRTKSKTVTIKARH